jgi:hypothetical protein
MGKSLLEKITTAAILPKFITRHNKINKNKEIAQRSNKQH